jgi:hypothetical protein
MNSYYKIPMADTETIVINRLNIFYDPITFYNEICENMLKLLFLCELSSIWYYGEGIYPKWSFKDRPYIKSIKFTLNKVDIIIDPLNEESWEKLGSDHLESLKFFIKRQEKKGKENSTCLRYDVDDFLYLVGHNSLVDSKHLESQGLILEYHINPYGEEVTFGVTSASFKLENSDIKFDFVVLSKGGYHIITKEGDYKLTNNPGYGIFLNEKGNLRYSATGFQPKNDKGERASMHGRCLTLQDCQNIRKYQRELGRLYHRHKISIKEQYKKLLWISYYKNQDNQSCLLAKLPIDFINFIISFL